MTTEQANMNRNPEGKGGFGEHPENRNDGGRIKNPLKEFSLQEFNSWTDKQKRDYLAKVNPIDRWKMTEGNPIQDITSGGKELNPILVKFIDGKEGTDNRDTPGVQETV